MSAGAPIRPGVATPGGRRPHLHHRGAPTETIVSATPSSNGHAKARVTVTGRPASPKGGSRGRQDDQHTGSSHPTLACLLARHHHPPLNVIGPETVRQFQAVIDELEVDGDVRVVVFDSAVEGYFLNHSDFTARLEDLTSMPAGPTGLPPWPDFLVRLTRAPVASIALIRGRATGNGSELTLACDMSFASREKAIFSQWGWAWAWWPGEARWLGCPRSWAVTAPWRCS
jgi:hypothetical protein